MKKLIIFMFLLCLTKYALSFNRYKEDLRAEIKDNNKICFYLAKEKNWNDKNINLPYSINIYDMNIREFIYEFNFLSVAYDKIKSDKSCIPINVMKIKIPYKIRLSSKENKVPHSIDFCLDKNKDNELFIKKVKYSWFSDNARCAK